MQPHPNPAMKQLNLLFCTWEGGGNVAPALALAQKLARRGHRVRFMSDACNRSDAEAFGLAFVPWAEAPSRPHRGRDTCPLRDWECTEPGDDFLRLIDGIMFRPALAYARDVLTELGREPADLVVTSEMLPGVLAACEGIAQRCAVFTANLMFYPVDGMPAFGPGLPPPRTPEDQAMHDEVRAAGHAIFDKGLEGLNRSRVHLGLAPLDSAADQLKSADLILLGTAKAFDFPSHPPANLHYVGPQLAEPAWAEPWDAGKLPQDDRSLVLAGFSTTFQDHARCLQAVIDAAAKLPVRLLVTLGDLQPGELRPAENTTLVPSAPHNAVMREAAIVVSHGGHGTVMRALLHRRPLLVMPHGRDQNENAVRVAERGAGLSLPPGSTAEEISDALRRLLEQPSFTEKAQRLGGAIEKEMLEGKAETLLEALAAAGDAEEKGTKWSRRPGRVAPLLASMAAVAACFLAGWQQRVSAATPTEGLLRAKPSSAATAVHQPARAARCN